ncbi:unnamed protein product [Orchesella dallaii]|uniref:Uncharacterized protein n=1 Tax=Orchesella dallaii TaxID=48710 RepID=A0ABP1RJE0_9HEXA
MHSQANFTMANTFTLVFLIIILGLLNNALSFNIDYRRPIIIQKNVKSPNYFGASVSFLKSDQGASWVIIGAPKANSTLAAHNDIDEPGVIYQCTIGHSQESCRQLVMSTTGNFHLDTEHKVTDFKNGSFLGSPGSIALDSKNFLACAHKWENREVDGSDALMHGICYHRPKQDLFKDILPPPISTPSSPFASKLLPMATGGIGRNTFWRGAAAGFSVHLPKTGGIEIVMGAPGAERYRGSVIQYLSRDDGLTFQMRHMSNPLTYSVTVTPCNLLGYSISSGYFSEMGSSSPSSSSGTKATALIQYVAGAPRGNNLAGKVILFRFSETDDGSLSILDEIRGDQTGSYFGATLLPIDLNGDGFDDLLIGAPRHSRPQGLGQRSENMRMNSRGGVDIGGGFGRFGGYGDEGAVFVYLSKEGTLSRNSKVLNGGNRPWAQFGMAMAALGDLNKDGYHDFAVAAPFEGGTLLDGQATGTVYIYHGSESGQITSSAQVIRASDIDNRLRGFGISLGGNEDIDNNGFNDIVIGSFNSSQTVILRSKPVITVVGEVKSTLKKLELGTEAFYIESCVKYAGTNAPNSTSLKVRLISDIYIMPKRVKISEAERSADLQNQLDYIVDLSINIQSCKKIYARVTQPLESSGAAVVFRQNVFVLDDEADRYKVKSRVMDVGLTGTVTVTGESFNSFCETCAVFDTVKQKPQELQLPLEVPCGDDNKCEVDLQLKVGFRDITDQGFLIGSSDSLFMDVEMLNLRETAISPAVLISWSKLTLKRTPNDCNLVREEGSILTYKCNLGKLLEESKSATVILEFDTSNLVYSEKLHTDIVFNVTAQTASEMIQPSSQTILLPLYASADPFVTGSRYLEIFNTETISPFVVSKHVYELGLKGYSSLANIWAVFSLPVNLTTSTGTVINVRGVAVTGNGEMACHPTKGHFAKTDLDLSTISSNSNNDVDYLEPDFDMAGIGGYLPKDKDVSKESNSTLVEKGRLLIHCDSPFVACMEVTCKAAVLKSGAEIEISFVIDIESDVVRDLLESHKVSAIQVESKGVLVLPDIVKSIQPENNEPDETNAITLIEKETYKRVSKWIYTLAIVIGLLVLACVAFCLYACGCFEKKIIKRDAVDNPEEAIPLASGKDVEMTRQDSEGDYAEPPDFVPHYPTIHEEDEHDEEENHK